MDQVRVVLFYFSSSQNRRSSLVQDCLADVPKLDNVDLFLVHLYPSTIRVVSWS